MSLINSMLSHEQLAIAEVAWYPTRDRLGQPSAACARRIETNHRPRWCVAGVILPDDACLFGSSDAARIYASKYLVTKIKQHDRVTS